MFGWKYRKKFGQSVSDHVCTGSRGQPTGKTAHGGKSGEKARLDLLTKSHIQREQNRRKHVSSIKSEKRTPFHSQPHLRTKIVHFFIFFNWYVCFLLFILRTGFAILRMADDAKWIKLLATTQRLVTKLTGFSFLAALKFRRRPIWPAHDNCFTLDWWTFTMRVNHFLITNCR